MANVVFVGDAPTVAQVSESEIDGFHASTTYGITINGKTVTQIGTTNAPTTIGLLVTALNNSTIPEFAEITWAEGSSTSHVKGTADTAGRPFTAASYTTGASGTMDPTTGNPITAVTANSGPNDAAVTANYSGAALPTNSDTLIFQNSNVDFLYNLEQYATNTFAITQHQSYTGRIGLADINTDGSTPYYEYRERFFKQRATVIRLGTGNGLGSGRIRLDSNTATGVTVTVDNTGNAVNQDLGAVQIKGMTGDIVARNGTIGLALLEDESATINTLDIFNATVQAGASCGVKDVNNRGTGTVVYRKVSGSSDDINIGGGSITKNGTGTVTSATVNEGTLVWAVDGSGPPTITTLVVGPGGTFDASAALDAFTLTNCTVHPGGVLLDPNGLGTYSNGVIIGGNGRIEDVTLDVGRGKTLTPS